MSHVLTFLAALVTGALCMYLGLVNFRRALRAQQAKQRADAEQNREALETIKTKQDVLNEQAKRLQTRESTLEDRFVSYRELQEENGILKRDLQNVDVNLRKLQLDRQVQAEAQETLDQRSQELGSRYLKESIKWISSSLNVNNFVNQKQRLQKVVTRCRGIGLDVSADQEASLLADLREEYERAVRAAFEREEQARIKAQIREEQKLEKEIERELRRLDRERSAIQAALEKALAEAKDKHSDEIERLRERLAEAEEKVTRTKSRAEMTRSGHVYVISNIGSFGEGVYKIGMTRRLEPTERVRELSSASVPFPFDVHMMVSCDDAPALENALHRAMHKHRLNKMNPRKEFFRADIEDICSLVEKNHGEVQYVVNPEALQYRQSLEMTDEDVDFVESVYSGLAEKQRAIPDDV